VTTIFLCNVNCSETVEAMDFKFGMPVPRDSLEMTPYIFEKWAWPG